MSSRSKSDCKRRRVPNDKQGSKRSTGTLELIDTILRKKIEFYDNEGKQNISIIGAIFTQLIRKELEGDKKAAAVRLQYQSVMTKEAGAPEIIIDPVYADFSTMRNADEEEL